MASLNVKVAVRDPRSNSPNSVPITDVSESQMRDAVSVSAFGDEADAKRFLRNNREMLHQLGWDEDAEVQTLSSTDTGEILGAYLPKRAPMTDDDARNALESLTS